MIEFDLTTPYFNGCNWIEWIGISFECLSTTVKIVGFYVFPQKYLIADFLFSQTFWILFDYSQMTWIRSNGNIFSETALAEWVTRKLLKLKIVSLFSYLLCWEIDKMHENVGFTQNTLVFHALNFNLWALTETMRPTDLTWPDMTFDFWHITFDFCHLTLDILYYIWYLIFDFWHLTFGTTWYSYMLLTQSQLIFTDRLCGYLSSLKSLRDNLRIHVWILRLSGQNLCVDSEVICGNPRSKRC